LRQIVVGADESDVSRAAVHVARQWAEHAGARVSAVHVGPLRPAATAAASAGAGVRRAWEAGSGDGIERWLAAESDREPTLPRPELAYRYGITGIEIARFAEEAGAALLVVGRKPRSPGARLLVGDTADAVARRSLVPCLFVRGSFDLPVRMLVGLDGTDRGLGVLRRARAIADAIGAELEPVTVEPARRDEPAELAASAPSARSLKLMEALRGTGAPLRVRRGDVVRELLAEASAAHPTVLVVGYHRGGPPGVLEAGSVARRIAHHASCAVLTIPL
jgi:nucleotide-binding universal stress UspA family protein